MVTRITVKQHTSKFTKGAKIMKGKFVGDAIEHLQSKEEIYGDYFAETLDISKSSASAMKNNKRTMGRETALKAIREFGNTAPKFTMMLNREFSNNQTAPVIDGLAVDVNNHLAMLMRLRKEMMDVKEAININDMLRDPQHATENERSSILNFLIEAREMDWYLDNTIATLIESYGFNNDDINERVTRKMKSEGALR
jgi:plasmid maintenance system antidote protein VapI